MSAVRTLNAALAAAVAAVLAVALLPTVALADHFTHTVELSAGSNVGAAVALSRVAFPDGAGTALLGRSDRFPDSLASGVAQDGSPLLLTQPDRLAGETRDELRRLGVTRVHLLGGTGAVSDGVANELRRMGLTVSRSAGPTRLETAVAVARTQPDAGTALLARAFGSAADPSGGFADALAAGAWSAATGWPILLSESDALSDATARYLRGSAIHTVHVVGGRAAISDLVIDDLRDLGVHVTRVGGATRAATAAAVAQQRGFSSRTPARVVLIEGRADQAWAPGFAAAALAARRHAAVLLADGSHLPEETRTTLASLASGTDRSALTCAPYVARNACEAAAEALGHDPVVDATSVTVTVTDARPGERTFTAAGRTHRYTAADTFRYSSGLASPQAVAIDAFATYVGAGDTLEITTKTGAPTAYRIVTDIPAAPGGVQAVRADVDGDGSADDVRVTWTRPANPDLRATRTYTVQRAAVAANGSVGSFGTIATVDGPGALAVGDLNAPVGTHRYRILAASSAGDGPASAAAAVVVPGATEPPYAQSSGFERGGSGKERDDVLGNRDEITFVFDTSIAVADGASVLLRDRDGTLARVVHGTHATFSVDDGRRLVIRMHGDPALVSTDGGNSRIETNTPTAVESASGIAGLDGSWNLAESGRADVASRVRVFGGTNGALPAPPAAAQVSADATTERVVIRPGASGIAQGDPFTVFDRRGAAIATGVYDAKAGTTVTAVPGFDPGARLLLVYTDLDTARLPSRTAVLQAESGPALAITSGPAPGSTVTTAQPVFGGSAADPGGSVTSIQRRIDSTNPADWVTTGITASPALPASSTTWSFTPPPLSDGSHTVELRAIDSAGLVSAVTTVTFTVGAAAPTMTEAAVEAGASSVVVTFSRAITCPSAGAGAWSLDDQSAANSDRVAATSTNKSGLTAQQCRIVFGGPAFAPSAFGLLTYREPASAAQRTVDASGGRLADLATVAARDTVAPALSAVLAGAGTSTVTLELSEPVRCADLDAGDLAITVAGQPRTIAGFDCAAPALRSTVGVLVAGTPLLSGDHVSVTVVSTAEIRDEFGNLAQRPQTRDVLVP